MKYDAATAQTADYVFATLSISILLLRLTLEYWRQRTFDLNFYLASASIAAVVGRLVTTHCYLNLGAAEDYPDSGTGFPYDSTDTTYVKAGQILVIVTRIFFTVILWLQICLILTFYARLVSGVTVVTWALRVIWFAVAATFVAVILITFLECRPFELYWHRSPTPACAGAYAQILVQCGSNIFLDVVVLIIAFPLTRLGTHSCTNRLRLYVLVGMGAACIVITVTRVVQVFKEPSQHIRSVWASVQMAVAVIVANAPSIYGSLKLLKRARASDNTRSFDVADSNDSNRLPPLVGFHSMLGETGTNNSTPTSTS